MINKDEDADGQKEVNGDSDEDKGKENKGNEDKGGMKIRGMWILITMVLIIMTDWLELHRFKNRIYSY